MTHKHLTTVCPMGINEITIIESYLKQNVSVVEISYRIDRSRQTIYNIKNFWSKGFSVLDYWLQYCENKRKCGRKKIIIPTEEKEYIEERVKAGWTPDVIAGRKERQISCSGRTLYRRFKEGVFDISTVPMQGKRKPNGHVEKRGKQTFRRDLREREKLHPDYKNEFGHLEGDTIVGVHHKSAIITLVEPMSKVIIALKPEGRKAKDIEKSLDVWFKRIPRNLFQSITFDCGKEFSNWKETSNKYDVHIYFADPGTPSQRPLNEHSNGLLRRDGLHKNMDFNDVDQYFVSSVAHRRNSIPRKSLNYKTPLEVFLSYLDENELCLT